MAEVIVKSSLNPHKAVRFNISLKKFYNDVDEAEEKYYLEVGTTHSGIFLEEDTTTFSGTNGIRIRPYYLDSVNNQNLDVELSNVIGYLSSYIDWENIYEDRSAPYVESMSPVGEDVSLYANVNLKIVDDIPTTGIDLSEIKVMFDNGTVEFDITSEVVINGDPFIYNLFWQPTLRVL
jgi:hypothetical protein